MTTHETDSNTNSDIANLKVRTVLIRAAIFKEPEIFLTCGFRRKLADTLGFPNNILMCNTRLILINKAMNFLD